MLAYYYIINNNLIRYIVSTHCTTALYYLFRMFYPSLCSEYIVHYYQRMFSTIISNVMSATLVGRLQNYTIKAQKLCACSKIMSNCTFVGISICTTEEQTYYNTCMQNLSIYNSNTYYFLLFKIFTAKVGNKNVQYIIHSSVHQKIFSGLLVLIITAFSIPKHQCIKNSVGFAQLNDLVLVLKNNVSDELLASQTASFDYQQRPLQKHILYMHR